MNCHSYEYILSKGRCLRYSFISFGGKVRSSCCLFACLLVCLFACWLVCLFACLLACLLVCLFACLLVCLFACLLVGLFACLLVCLFVSLLVCLFAWLFGCLVAWLLGSLFACLLPACLLAGWLLFILFVCCVCLLDWFGLACVLLFVWLFGLSCPVLSCCVRLVFEFVDWLPAVSGKSMHIYPRAADCSGIGCQGFDSLMGLCLLISPRASESTSGVEVCERARSGRRPTGAVPAWQQGAPKWQSVAQMFARISRWPRPRLWNAGL